MVNAPVSFRRFRFAPIALVVAAAFAPAVLAQEADRDLYAAARALEQTARVSLDDPAAQAERSLDDVHTAVAAYLLVPRRYPASSFSDDALWKAGHLSLDAFARFGRTGDRDAGQRALKRLVTGYPGSKLAKQVPAALAGAPPPAVAAAAPVSAPVIEPPPAPVPVATTSTVPATPPATPPALPPAAPATPRAKPAARANGSTATIRSIRRTVLPDAVRIIIELDGEVAFQQERIAGPDRVFLDLSPSRAAPPLQDQTLRFNSDSDVVRQVRLGRHENRTTRIVLDAGGVGTYSVYALYNPYRLVIDCVRAKAPEVAPPPLLAAKRLSPAWARQLPSAAPLNAVALREAAIVPKAAPVPRTPAPAPAPAAPVVAATAAPAATPAAAPIVGPPLPGPPTVVSADLPGIQAVIVRAPSPVPVPPPAPSAPLVSRSLTAPWNRKPLAALSPRSAAAIREAVASLPPPADSTSPLGPGTIPPEQLPGSVPPSAAAWTPPPADKNSRTPDKNANGSFSIARQLGLGVSRIVIDPGHGGHDPGAQGKDVGEAELVLDVSLRLEKLLQKIPGIEVVLTRRTDDFVTLQERTAIANRENADLFLSIHANANESPYARGVETYFLNFANNLGAAAVAARENAASGQAMAALPDLVKMIALNNKLDESRELATMVQQAMIERLRGVNKSLKDLGVKQAPFAVLIGAAMPSVLAEVSFITNTQDAKQLRSSLYRQRIAEALANAVRKYQTSLKTVTTVAQE